MRHLQATLLQLISASPTAAHFHTLLHRHYRGQQHTRCKINTDYVLLPAAGTYRTCEIQKQHSWIQLLSAYRSHPTHSQLILGLSARTANNPPSHFHSNTTTLGSTAGCEYSVPTLEHASRAPTCTHTLTHTQAVLWANLVVHLSRTHTHTHTHTQFLSKLIWLWLSFKAWKGLVTVRLDRTFLSDFLE